MKTLDLGESRPSSTSTGARSPSDVAAAVGAARQALRPGAVEIGALRRLLGDTVSAADLDACLLSLEREGGISLIPHARPDTLEPLDAHDGVPSPRGLLYFLLWHD
jgi:hypothetical protein